MDLLLTLVEFLDSTAGTIGTWVVRAVEWILPGGALPPDVVAPIGWLVLLTAGLALAEAGRRLAWGVVVAGWLLVIIRLVLAVAQAPPGPPS